METKKIKVLWVGDYNCPTGFAEVSKNILHLMADDDRFDISVLAVNCLTEDVHYPVWFPIYYAKSKYGMDEIAETFDKVQPDILITLNDGYVMPMYHRLLGVRLNKCSWIGYITFDGLPIARWKETLKHMDVVAVPTEWQRQELNKVMPALDVKVLPYGVNTKYYHKLPKQEVDDYKLAMLGEEHKNDFIFGMVGKNFERKRYPELIQAFAIFKYKSKLQFPRNPLLVLFPTHSKGQFNLDNVAKVAGTKPGDVAIINSDSPFGLTDTQMNKIYNMFDINCLISIGEGFGLPTVNAAACGKPTIAMDNSVQGELSTKIPMALVSTDEQSPVWFGMDMEQVRYVPDCKVLAHALRDMYYNMVLAPDAEQSNNEVSNQAIAAVETYFTWDDKAELLSKWIIDEVNRDKRVAVIE